MKTFKTQTRASPIPWRGKAGKCKAVTRNIRFLFLQALSLFQKSWNKSALKAFDSHQWIHLIQKHTGHQKLGRQFITYYFHHISSFFYILRCTTKIKKNIFFHFYSIVEILELLIAFHIMETHGKFSVFWWNKPVLTEDALICCSRYIRKHFIATH